MLRADGASNRPLRIADLGTGSGAILLALLSELPEAYGVSAPISARLRYNRTHQCRQTGTGRSRDVRRLRLCAGLSGPFDLIVSNPPYIRSADIADLATEVRDYDPLAALDGGADGLDAYRALIPQAACLLAPGGALVVEAGQGQSGQIEGLMTAAGLTLEGPQSRSGGHPKGGRRPQNASIKSYWNAKKPLGIFPGSDYVPLTTSVQGCCPRNNGWRPEFSKREPAE